MKKFFLFIIFYFSFICYVKCEDVLSLKAPSAILIESSTGKVLYEKEAHVKRSPASMTKMMTLLLTMEALEDGRIKLDDKVFISKKAASMGGTQIFVEENSYVSIETLLKGICIASANDASVALAEHIGGNLDRFVGMMNDKARELGCKNTNFKNPHGLDEEGHYSSTYDMAIIARELIKYPYILKLTSTYEDNINVSGENHWLVNTNKLIRFYSGIDGLKTGYTSKAMYCLTATMERNNMRLISVVMKEDNKDNRSKDTISLMEYGFSNYGSKNIYNKNSFYGYLVIENSNNRKIKYYLDRDVNLIVNKNVKDVNYTVDIKLDKVKAPIKKNSIVGKLLLNYDNKAYSYDLIVHEDVKKASFFEVYKNLFKDIINGVRIRY